VFKAVIPDNSWLGIGFGPTMSHTDMIVWSSIKGVGSSADMFSFKHDVPRVDNKANLRNEVAPSFDKASKTMAFVTRRKLDTGDDEFDYVVKLDAEIAMSVAYERGSGVLRHKHDEWDIWTLKVTEKGVTSYETDIRELLRSEVHETHGLWMWSAWFCAGLLLLATKRYMKKTWRLNHYVHALLGYFVLAVSIVFALSVTSWQPFEEVHHAFGSLTVVITIAGALTGTITAAMMRFYNGDKPWSKQEKVEIIGKIHRYSGYLMLLIGNAAIMTGVGHYYGNRLKNDERRVLGIFSLIVFLVLVAIFEGLYRTRNKYSMGHIQVPTDSKIKTELTIFDLDGIAARVKSGQRLVILDNLVLDLKGFERLHPGGKFSLTHNLGRDISKFFFGGYALQGGRKPHTHSKAALDIVETLIVGTIDQ